MELYYNDDLAYIHDSAYGNFARHSAEFIVKTIEEKVGSKGLVIDLGCGSGIAARVLLDSGHQVLGIDLSQSLITIAQQRASEATFVQGSFFDVPFPESIAVVSTSECLNYLFDERNDLAMLEQLFDKIYKALSPGGVFIFDILEPAQRGETYALVEKDDWTMFVRRVENTAEQILTRDIVIFRKIDGCYRKSKEFHKQRLYYKNSIIELLRNVGFEAGTFECFNVFNAPLLNGHIGYLATKPSR